jgi:hypothetical protein
MLVTKIRHKEPAEEITASLNPSLFTRETDLVIIVTKFGFFTRHKHEESIIFSFTRVSPVAATVCHGKLVLLHKLYRM